MVWRPRLKLALLGLVVLGLAGILAFAAVREATTTGPAAAAPRPSIAPPRRALTAAEETYARALWSIHDEVKNGAFRMTLTGINFKIGDIDRAELRTRVASTIELFRRAESRAQALEPPASLHDVHAEYLQALRLFQRSGAEMLKTSEDGQTDHLVAALPLSQDASRLLLTVGQQIWPGEYVPN